MKWKCYRITPIDFGWEHLDKIQDVARELIPRDEFNGPGDEGYGMAAARFLQDWEEAKTLARENGWEGDFREEPSVFWLPMETEMGYGFVIKHDNNGDTFVITPVEMPWLERTHCCPTNSRLDSQGELSEAWSR